MSDETSIMTIQDVFDKHRNPLRSLNTIVKVSDTSAKNIWTEFEEFVVTETLLDYFLEFYNAFSTSISFDEPKMPFWLEGFYGSGKSHFAKVLGHLFQNSSLADNEGNEWSSIDFFIEYILKPAKFDDGRAKKAKTELIKGLELYSKQIKARTIFINLSQYSRSETNGESFLESFTRALLKEFNQFIGLSDIIQTAELEKALMKRDLFDAFKTQIQEDEGETWEEIRKNTSWVMEAFLKSYPKVNECDASIAEAFLRGIEIDSQQKSILDVLREINDWAEQILSEPEKGLVGKVLIVLDEAGLFFSTKASRIGEMMAAAEWINTPGSQSRINMIFSAQQSIKQYIENVKVNVDYRTAEQRFTHWTLDKKNIKMVVTQRWLKKDADVAGEALHTMLDDKYHAIIDGTVFDTIKDPNLDFVQPKKEDLFDAYPFLPYQFPLMIQVTQKLISEKVVAEQYGGKTRSILSMTRDVLNGKIAHSTKLHFIEENLGTFVTLPFLYDSIVEVLKTKDEDQFQLVDNTKNLVEDPSIFTPEDGDVHVTFTDVAKTVLLLKYVDEVFVNDETIIKCLFNSVDASKNSLAQKVRKLTSELKKKGFLSYRKREIEDADGEMKEIIEYQIPSQEERKYIERTWHVPITEEQVESWLKNFFKEKEGEGKDLITFRDAWNIPELKGSAGQMYNLDNAIRMKLEWLIDPDLEEILGKMTTGQNSTTICLLTNRTLQLEQYATNHHNLEVAIRQRIVKALKDKKLLVFITPSLASSAITVSQKLDILVKTIHESIRYQETLKDQTMPGNVQTGFNQRIKDLSRDLFNILAEDYDGGTIFYLDAQDRIDKDKINEKVLVAVKLTYSKVYPYAYLGQVKINKNDIEIILKWDSLKQANAPAALKKGSRTPAGSVQVFTEKNELKPNQAEQYNHVTLKFKEYMAAHQEIDQMPGEILKSMFDAAPFGWNDQTLLATVAAIVRVGEWDVMKGGSVKNPTDKDIIDAFTDFKSDCEKFGNLKFKTAEAITQEELTTASKLLLDIFAEQVSQVGREVIDDRIKKVLTTLSTLIVGTKPALEKLRFWPGLSKQIDAIKGDADIILRNERSISRIKSFLDAFSYYGAEAERTAEFNQCKDILNRVNELSSSGSLEKFLRLDKFISGAFTSWLSTQLSRGDVDQLRSSSENVLGMLDTSAVLFGSGWDDAWNAANPLWTIYWNSYIALHEKLLEDIANGIKRVEDAKTAAGSTKKISMKRLTSTFSCTQKLTPPVDIDGTGNLVCQACKHDYNALRVFEGNIGLVVQQILKDLDTSTGRGGGTGGSGGSGGKGGTGDGGVTGGSGDHVEELTTEQRESWVNYRSKHAEIEKKMQELHDQETVFQEIPEILVEFKSGEEELGQKHSAFSSCHACSDEPVNWVVELQACTNCNCTYDDLVDLHALIEGTSHNVLEILRNKQESLLPVEFGMTVQVDDDTALNEQVEEKARSIKTNIMTYRKLNPGANDKITITIKLEKSE